MYRKVFIFAALLASLCLAVPAAQAGWLSDKLKDAGKDLGGKVIDDKSDSPYGATGEKQDPGQVSEQDMNEMDAQAPMEEEPALEEETPWGNQRPSKKIRKRRSSAPVRTDLHFSADASGTDTSEDAGGSYSGKIYIDGARMRMDFESGMGDDSGGPMTIIVTGAAPEDEIYTVMHKEKMYMMATVGDAEEDFWANYTAADNPCDGYSSAKKLGKQAVSGREAVRWECRSPENSEDPDQVDFWIDAKLGVPVRSEASDGSSFELNNINTGRPAADLFKLPAGYKEFAWGNVQVNGGQAPPSVAAALGEARVPVYPGAVFCIGTTDSGLRYATSDPPEKVRNWSRKQRPGWQLYQDPSLGDLWVLYEGPQKIAAMAWMQYNMAQIGTNENLPSWHSLPGDMTTEIVLGVADRFK